MKLYMVQNGKWFWVMALKWLNLGYDMKWYIVQNGYVQRNTQEAQNGKQATVTKVCIVQNSNSRGTKLYIMVQNGKKCYGRNWYW